MRATAMTWGRMLYAKLRKTGIVVRDELRERPSTIRFWSIYARQHGHTVLVASLMRYRYVCASAKSASDDAVSARQEQLSQSTRQCGRRFSRKFLAPNRKRFRHDRLHPTELSRIRDTLAQYGLKRNEEREADSSTQGFAGHV